MSCRFYTKDLATWAGQAQPGKGTVGVADLFMTCLVNERLDSETLAIGRQGVLLPGPYLLYMCKWLQVTTASSRSSLSPDCGALLVPRASLEHFPADTWP